MMKIWFTKLWNKIINLFIVDYTWCCACFFIAQNIIHDFLYIHQRFAFIQLEFCFSQYLRPVKKNQICCFWKRVVARTELKIVNFITSFLTTNIVMKSWRKFWILNLIENDIVDMFDREACCRETYQRYSKWNDEQLLFFLSFGWMSFFCSNFEQTSRSQFFRDFMFFDRDQRNLMV